MIHTHISCNVVCKHLKAQHMCLNCFEARHLGLHDLACACNVLACAKWAEIKISDIHTCKVNFICARLKFAIEPDIL